MLEVNGSTLFQIDSFKVFQSHAQVTRTIEDFMLCAECRGENTSWKDHKARLPLFSSNGSFMRLRLEEFRTQGCLECR